MTRTECYAILNHLRLVGPVRVRRLIAAFGSVEALFAQSAARLAAVEGIGPAVAESIRDWEKICDWSAHERKMREHNMRLVDCEDAAYPKSLLEIYDPPLVLYYRGDLEAVRRLSIAVVGSRQTTYYGLEMAKKLSYQIAYAGVTVVSGLARGIDTAAHQAALAAKGRTVAVLGSSLDCLYPSENRELAALMEERGGAVLSEFAPDTPPDRQTFPMRNRIVSGISSGVLVVEAGLDSGALITARQALDQGRQVFAMPGRIDTPQAKGCHRLIKDGAKLVEDASDILAEFEFLFPKEEKPSRREEPGDLGEEERKIWEALGVEEQHVDEIARKCGLPSAKVSSTLLRLEMRKLARQLPGKYFVRTD